MRRQCCCIQKNYTYLFNSAMSKAVQGTPRVISEMLLMAGLMKARQVVTPDRTPTAALNRLLNRIYWQKIAFNSKLLITKPRNFHIILIMQQNSGLPLHTALYFLKNVLSHHSSSFKHGFSGYFLTVNAPTSTAMIQSISLSLSLQSLQMLSQNIFLIKFNSR